MKKAEPAMEEEFKAAVVSQKKKAKAKNDTDKRLTVVLPIKTYEMLQALSSMQSTTLNEAIRRAISTEAFIRNEVEKGSKILVKSDEAETKELVFM